MAAIDPRNLADRIAALSPERIAEVVDFVEFLHLRDQDRSLSQAAAASSAAAFAAVWSNAEDDVYDEL